MDITITEQEADQRLDRFLRKYFKPYPKIKLADIYSRIRKGTVKVNGRKRRENYRLQIDDQISRDDSIQIDKDPHQFTQPKNYQIQQLDLQTIQSMIIVETDQRIVRNKPADIVTHPGNKHTDDLTMHDYQLAYLDQTEQLTDSPTFTPSFCFRLDKDTSGIIISAKTYESLQLLNKLIRDREVDKSYLAVVAGQTPAHSSIDTPLFKGYNTKTGRAETFINHTKGRSAYTELTTLSTREDPHLGTISLVQVTIHTGRMHQIRVHLASIGFPIIGDLTYGHPPLNRLANKHYQINRQLLHSHSYGFFDRFADKRSTFVAPTPADFISLMPAAGNTPSGDRPSMR